MSSQKRYRLFGDLWLPDPEEALSGQELIYVRETIPQIRTFEAEWTSTAYDPSGWSMDEAYRTFRDREFTWWKARGVIRSRDYMVRPSGQLNASVACHLYNPTFTVDDPRYGETEDLSNASMSQINDAGFSTQNNCFIFDHLARRDVSNHCATVYPEDLLDIHEEFVFALRDAMKAKIEICWGANVRKRMFKKLDLQPFRLWGDFAGVVLYMEMTPSERKLKRFIIFVAHPQRYLYVKSDGEKAQAWRRRFGVSQDQALTAAARLGEIQITPNFYVLDPRLPRNLCVPRTVSDQRSVWRGEAVAELKKAFPAAVLSMEKSHRIRPTKEDKSSVQDAFTLFAKLKPGKVNEAVNLPQNLDDTTLRNLRLQKVVNYWNDFSDLLGVFVSNAGTGDDQGMPAGQIAHTFDNIFAESQESDSWEWESLPDPLVEFIQAQDGLKFNKREISCRADLETAFELLQKCQGSPETLDIITLAVSVLASYGWMISRPRKPRVDGLLILREHPNDVIPRKCSGCGKEYLDDPFAYWSRYRSDHYVLWYMFHSNCGRRDCSAKTSMLLPLSGQIKYLPSTRQALEEKRPDQFNKWFLLRPEEFGELPSEVEVKCQNCQETRFVKARWTGHTPPRFVVAVHKCKETHKRVDWIPAGYPIIHGAQLSVLWKKSRGVPGFDITRYPRRPDIYFNGDLSIAGRIAALVQAKRLTEVEDNERGGLDYGNYILGHAFHGWLILLREVI